MAEIVDEVCLIVSGGPFYRPEEVPSGDFVIACDRGVAYAAELGIEPDFIVGDFDSYRGELPKGVPTVTLPVRKDDTDTGYALRYAVEHGFGRVRIAFALGGCLDHTLANLQSAAKAAKAGVLVRLEGEKTLAYVLSRSTVRLDVRRGQRLSVLSLGDVCRDVSIRGARYTLDRAVLYGDYPLGVSNQAEGAVEVSCGEGVLAVMLVSSD